MSWIDPEAFDRVLGGSRERELAQAREYLRQEKLYWLEVARQQGILPQLCGSNAEVSGQLPRDPEWDKTVKTLLIPAEGKDGFIGLDTL